jgi:WD40 repeat protein
LQTGNIVVASQKQPQEIRCVTFSGDGTKFATGCVDGTSRIWSTKDSMPITAPLAQGAPVTGCSFSPNSRWLLTTNGDAGSDLHSEPIVRGWDASTGEPLFALPLRSSPRRELNAPGTLSSAPLELQLACFSKDGHRLHIVLRDGSFTTLSLEADARTSPELLREIVTRSGTRPDGAGGLSTINPENLIRVFRREE